MELVLVGLVLLLYGLALLHVQHTRRHVARWCAEMKDQQEAIQQQLVALTTDIKVHLNPLIDTTRRRMASTMPAGARLVLMDRHEKNVIEEVVVTHRRPSYQDAKGRTYLASHCLADGRWCYRAVP